MLFMTVTMIFTALSVSHALGASTKGELLLKFKPGVSQLCKERILSSSSLEVLDEIPQIETLVVSVPQDALLHVESALSHNPMIDFVEENRQIPPSAIPNDPYLGSEWHLTQISAPQAWDVSTGNANVIVAVLDSGVDPSHPDLAGKLLSGYNFYDNNDNTSDVYGHGTKVAGVAAAVTNNSRGVAAIAWQSSILPIRVTDTGGYTTYSLLAKGLTYAAERGAKTATMSFLIYGGSTLSSAAKYFMDKGGLAVAAGGNTGAYQSDSDNPYILSVSATTSTDSLATFSTYGPYIDLSAPGVSIMTTVRGGGYGSVSGTSFSAPLTAGLASLIFSANPTLTPYQVEQVLESTAVDLGVPGYDTYYGWGRINASSALRAATGVTPPKDNTLPIVTITSPSNGSIVSGGITVSVTASDNVAVSKVELYKDGNLFATDATSPWEFYWNTASDTNDLHTLVAKAYDTSSNVGQSNTVTVNVFNTHEPTSPDFALSASPSSLNIKKGSSKTSTMTVTWLNGFSSAVNLTASCPSAGVTYTLSPSSVTSTSGSATSKLTLTVSSSTPAATYTITITGTSGSLKHTIAITVKVPGSPK
jgi:subtilisin family serine protease